jgi:hypothetical protein
LTVRPKKFCHVKVQGQGGLVKTYIRRYSSLIKGGQIFNKTNKRREVKDKHMTAQERFTRMADIHIHSGLDGAHQVISLIKPTRFFHKAICKLKYYLIRDKEQFDSANTPRYSHKDSPQVRI